MKRILAFLVCTLALAGCGNGAGLPTRDTALQDHLRNPLYAEYYYDDLTEQMVKLALRQPEDIADPAVRSVVDRTRTRSLEHAEVARKAQEKGLSGIFLSDNEPVLGEALLQGDVLYFGPTFDCAPGPSLQVYLTHDIDPRDNDFPDDTTVLLGAIKDQYGAQAFAVPSQRDTGTGSALRTVVLWDDELDLLYGFAQLSKAQK